MRTRTIRLLSLLLIALLAWSLSACGDDSNDEMLPPDEDVTEPPEEDTTEPGEEDTTEPGEEDTTDPGEEDTTEPDDDCDHRGFTAAAQDAFNAMGAFVYMGQSTTGAPVDSLNFELIEVDEPGDFDLAGQNYADCEHCVILWQGCDEHLEQCEKTFFVDEGTLSVSSTGDSGDTFSGELSDVVLLEVDIDPEDDFASTPVDGGEKWCLSKYAFSTEIQ